MLLSQHRPVKPLHQLSSRQILHTPEGQARVRRDVESGLASGEVRGTPTLFIDGVFHLGGYDAATLREALGA